MTADQILAVATGPGSALVVLIAGGRWLMKRLEAREAAYDKLLAEVTAVVRENTVAITKVNDSLNKCAVINGSVQADNSGVFRVVGNVNK